MVINGRYVSLVSSCASADLCSDVVVSPVYYRDQTALPELELVLILLRFGTSRYTELEL